MKQVRKNKTKQNKNAKSYFSGNFASIPKGSKQIFSTGDVQCCIENTRDE
jgi:hypothetical protein